MDFDGVILDTAQLKTDAYLTLYPGVSIGVRAHIRSYCDQRGGVPRYQKFKHIETRILGRPVTEERLIELSAAFRGEVFDRVLAAPFIPGAKEFLEEFHKRYLLFVISGTPQAEINYICGYRGLTPFFSTVAGSPIAKEQWIARFLSEHSLAESESIMVGDSMTDWEAAHATGVFFVGVGKTAATILPSGTDVIPDLTQLAATVNERCRHCALNR